jgi:LIM homeobox transcription factor 1
MEPFRGNYFNSYHHMNNEEIGNQYYDPFYVKHRKRTTKAQLKVLEKTFDTCPRPDSAMRKKLGDELAMTPRSVQVWFQNRRAKVKKQQQAIDNPKTSPDFHPLERAHYRKTMDHFELYPTNNSIMNRMSNSYNYDNGNNLHMNFMKYNDESPFNMYEPRYDKRMYPYE